LEQGFGFGVLLVLTMKPNSHPQTTGDIPMDWDRIEGNWKQFRGKVKEQWGELTDDDLDVIEGNRDQLEGRLQERYGKAKDDVRKDVDTWLDKA